MQPYAALSEDFGCPFVPFDDKEAPVAAAEDLDILFDVGFVKDAYEGRIAPGYSRKPLYRVEPGSYSESGTYGRKARQFRVVAASVEVSEVFGQIYGLDHIFYSGSPLRRLKCAAADDHFDPVGFHHLRGYRKYVGVVDLAVERVAELYAVFHRVGSARFVYRFESCPELLYAFGLESPPEQKGGCLLRRGFAV